ncbi:hypothetical protein D9M68_955430 [compost metagenome]
MLKPMSCQMPITASVASAVEGSLRKATGAKPNHFSRPLTGPREGWSRNCQTVAMTISVEVTGRK